MTLINAMQVPVLTQTAMDLLPNQSLVRFRGMVRWVLCTPGAEACQQLHWSWPCVTAIQLERGGCQRSSLTCRSPPPARLLPLSTRPPPSTALACPPPSTHPHPPCTQVADMLNPEFYVGEYRRADGSWQTAKYQDQVLRCGWVGALPGSVSPGSASMVLLEPGARGPSLPCGLHACVG